MSLFGSKSLVDTIDELISLVSNWNAMHTNSRTRINTKKRSHPTSPMLSTLAATPAKKSKLNNPSDPDLNCLYSLESEARSKLIALTTDAIESIYKTTLSPTEQSSLLSSQISRPRREKQGEIALQCFKLAKHLKIKPKPLAESLVSALSTSIQSNTGTLFLCNPFAKVEAANGRINTFLTVPYLASILGRILDPIDSLLAPLPSTNERVMIEYSQPNTHKAFHVGHMRNVALGDCLARLSAHCGHETLPVNYFGDEGAHVAKCLWWIRKQMTAANLNLDVIEEKQENLGEWLGTMYATACTKLSLSEYTRFPFEGLVVAKVVSKEKHPKADAPKGWHVVSVETVVNGREERFQVICGGTEYNVGDLIAYCPVGCVYKGTVAVEKDMKGVVSCGVIMGAKEVGVKLPPMTVESESKESPEKSAESKAKGGKKAKKSKKKNKAKKDDRIYLVGNDYPDAKLGDMLTALGRKTAYASVDDVVVLWKTYCAEQKETLKMLEGGDAEVVALWKRTREWSLDEFHKIYKWVGARFDHDFYESECSEDSRKLVDEFQKKGVFVESDGAVGIHLDEEKLGFCMLLKSNGSGLYATKDLSLARKKFEAYSIDRSVYVVDSTQARHFQQVFATLKRMGYEQADKCYHLSYAFVRLKEGKMATRTGTVILFSELVKLLSKEINEQYLDSKRENKEDGWSEQELKEAERAISAGAIRYGMLNHDNNKEIVFDLKEWTLSSGNTGPYLMYQYARISSIAKKVEWPKDVDRDSVSFEGLAGVSGSGGEDVVKQLLFELCQFQSKVKLVCDEKSPSQLCDYLYGVCKLFSSWYAQPENSVMRCEDPMAKAARLLFCEATAETIRVGIELLGITALKRM